MILTGRAIAAEVAAGRIVIDDFAESRLEPNSYGFRLGQLILVHDDGLVDCAVPPVCQMRTIGPDGFVLHPGRLYLGSTVEAMGSPHYSATLYARRSVATLGVWIQFSAPLGHSGSILPWTLEIAVSQPTRVYAGMVIGKIAFWAMKGDPVQYDGKYVNSRSVVASRLSAETIGRIGGVT